MATEKELVQAEEQLIETQRLLKNERQARARHAGTGRYLYSTQESWGSMGVIEVDVVCICRDIRLQKHLGLIQNSVNRACARLMQEVEEEGERQASNALLPEFLQTINKIFCAAGLPPACMEASPNEYRETGLPRLAVSTGVGIISVAWRRRVIELDWTRTIITKTADELFASEDVTKDGKMIHAWGYAKLEEYLKVLYAAQPQHDGMPTVLGVTIQKENA